VTTKAPKTNGLTDAHEDVAGGEATIKVLVAEDEPGVRQVMENLLRRWGYPQGERINIHNPLNTKELCH
jgi:hypothetical protein